MPNRTRTESTWFPQVIGAIDEEVIITATQEHTTWVNPGFTCLCGYSMTELRGQPPGWFLQGADTNPTTVHHIRTALQCSRVASGFANQPKTNV
jgi:hypothetical protein